MIYKNLGGGGGGGGGEGTKCKIPESKHSALEVYLFGHYSPEFISSLVP